MYIESTLYKFNDSLLPKNFVSIAVQINEEHEPYHAAIIIRHKNINYLHHFPGNKPPEVIENFNESGWFIYKILDSFKIDDESEIGSFLQYCKRVCNGSDITYSYIVDGSSYESTGEFTSNSGLPELGTCVGFCLNTLSNTLIDVQESVLFLEDWEDSDLNERVDEWSKNQASEKYPDLDWTLYNSFKKRITPLEFLCTSFFNEFPIKKDSVDSIKENVILEIKEFYKN